MSNSELKNLDRDHLIHPVTNFHAHQKKGVTVLESAQGVWLRDADGNECIDAFSGLWCVNVGYGHESIAKAAAEQMQRLPYATGYFSFGSEPAIRLAARLVELAPKSLQHVYFTLGGSDAADSAVRYITHYYNSLGFPNKKQFIALQRGYHGSSAMGSGLTGLPAFHNAFDVPKPNQHHIPCPYPYRDENGDDPQAVIDASVRALRAKVEQLGQENVAAFFCEPVIGSGGVIVPPKGWLKAMRNACTELDILMVVDEVITGFGRTGPMFACLDENVEPDILTMAKGLTSGYAPMGAVMLSEKVYDGIATGKYKDAIVGHGQTYSGHPVSAAVGLEVLRLYTEGGLLDHAAKVAPYFEQRLQEFRNHPLVGDARQRGLLGALELVANKDTKERFDPALQLSDRITKLSYENGVIFRTFADNILGFAPALCYTTDEFDIMFERVTKTLDAVLNQADIMKLVG